MSATRIAPARAAAFEILLKIATTDAHSDELLRSPGVDALSLQDRALTTQLTLGTIRWQLKLDSTIRALLARPNAKLTPAVETALRIGAFQILYLDRIPAHAAIGESVELAKKAGEVYAAGMVNAVLRNLIRSPHKYREEGSLADVSAHPEWMVERWGRFYGQDTARAICMADQQPAPTCLRLVHPAAEQALASEGIGLAPGEFLAAARRVVHGDAARTEAFLRGWARIQDEGSQLVAELAGHGGNILDVCAAPGGKTAVLSERNPEARLTARDVSRKRLDVMRRNSAAEHVQFEVQDATAVELRPEYDLILCDVPCTGTGTIARNPEIRFRVSESEIKRQHERQVKILSRALEGLTQEGRLLYATCSLEPEENEAVVEECLERAGGYAMVPLKDDLARLEREGILHPGKAAGLLNSGLRGGCLRTVPGLHGCDGFFAALIVRQ